MSQPEIKYCKTSDGVSIAYWVLGEGEGEPLVYMPWSPFGHIELEWQDTDSRRFFEGLASGAFLVHYDSRGSGLSDRDVEDLSLASRAWDLESVVGQLGLDRFSLWAPLGTGAVAVAYAAVFLINRYATPVYSVKFALVKVEKNNSLFSNSRGYFGGWLGPDLTDTKRRLRLIQSKNNVRIALGRLDFHYSVFVEGEIKTSELYPNRPFEVEIDR